MLAPRWRDASPGPAQRPGWDGRQSVPPMRPGAQPHIAGPGVRFGWSTVPATAPPSFAFRPAVEPQRLAAMWQRGAQTQIPVGPMVPRAMTPAPHMWASSSRAPAPVCSYQPPAVHSAPRPTQTPAVPSRALTSAPGLEVLDLEIGCMRPDISQQPLRSQFLSVLGLPLSAEVERLKGAQGGMNDGVWRVRSGVHDYIVKLVPSTHPMDGPGAVMHSEAEKFVKLAREHPELVEDSDVAFPRKIVRMAINHRPRHDLIVMWHMPGQRLAEVIASKWPSQGQAVLTTLREFGAFLARFHLRHGGLQHHDCQQSNVLYDEKTGDFTLLDVCDMAPQGALTELDKDRFVGGLKLLSSYFGPQFFAEGKRHFEDGYTSSLRQVRRGGA